MDPRSTLNYLAGWLLVVLAGGCGATTAGDPFGWFRPEELTTICHNNITMIFNHGKAEWHLSHHPTDTWGLCPPRVTKEDL